MMIFKKSQQCYRNFVANSSQIYDQVATATLLS